MLKKIKTFLKDNLFAEVIAIMAIIISIFQSEIKKDLNSIDWVKWLYYSLYIISFSIFLYNIYKKNRILNNNLKRLLKTHGYENKDEFILEQIFDNKITERNLNEYLSEHDEKYTEYIKMIHAYEVITKLLNDFFENVKDVKPLQAKSIKVVENEHNRDNAKISD